MISSEDRAAKFERFRHILEEPWHQSKAGTFPLFTTDRSYDLETYQSESQGNLPKSSRTSSKSSRTSCLWTSDADIEATLFHNV